LERIDDLALLLVVCRNPAQAQFTKSPRPRELGHATDSLWSADLFRCESVVLRRYWVLVVMDQFTRRLVGFGTHCGAITSADVCRMFNAAIYGQGCPDISSPCKILGLLEVITYPHNNGKRQPGRVVADGFKTSSDELVDRLQPADAAQTDLSREIHPV